MTVEKTSVGKRSADKETPVTSAKEVKDVEGSPNSTRKADLPPSPSKKHPKQHPGTITLTLHITDTKLLTPGYTTSHVVVVGQPPADPTDTSNPKSTPTRLTLDVLIHDAANISKASGEATI